MRIRDFCSDWRRNANPSSLLLTFVREMDVALEKKLSGYKRIALEKVRYIDQFYYVHNLTTFTLQLENLLLTIHGKKDLIVDPDLIRLLDSFANVTWLR